MSIALYQSLKSVILDRPYKQGIIIKNRYKIIKMLGMGSYGITYLVMDLTNKRECVLKQMKPSRRKEEKVRASFDREMQILSFLYNPQIPKLIEGFNFNGEFILIMDYINGRTFEDLIFTDGYIYDELGSLQILRKVLEIVSIIHENNIVHRDLRIPNIMKKDGEIYIIDFGLAHFVNESFAESDLDQEQYNLEKRLKREVHYKSDFYALGHFVLFLLYSNYSPNSKEERSWEDELPISNHTRRLIRKLLQIDAPYMEVTALIQDVDHIINE